MNEQRRHRRSDLRDIAREAMIERGLEPDFPPAVAQELVALEGPARDAGVRDLRALPWCSIDNDDSRDLDQLSVSEPLAGGRVRIQVAIADVDALVDDGTAIDGHARKNTTSVYTAGGIFPMLPERLSTDLTSLNAGEDRIAVVVDMVVGDDGLVGESAVYRAQVRNQAKLAYPAVGAWLEGRGPLPPAAARVTGLDRQLRVQDEVAQRLCERRHEDGALDLQSIEPRAVWDGNRVVDLAVDGMNRARRLIEDFMIAANGVTARFLANRKLPSLRRVVREPERWERIVEVAGEHGVSLPPDPDAKALSEFLTRERKRDPLRFPDLSLVIVKLMGKGEYVLEAPGREPIGHFGLSVRDYTHSTAPNRRYPDLLTQRQVKAALTGAEPAYEAGALASLAEHCTKQEDSANKVERQLRKSAAALLLEDRVGERFDGIVTGASDKGTWVRILQPPVEGKLLHGKEGLRVGAKVRVKLIDTDVERGFIDFARAG